VGAASPEGGDHVDQVTGPHTDRRRDRYLDRAHADADERGGRTRARTGQAELGDDLARRDVRDHDPSRGASEVADRAGRRETGRQRHDLEDGLGQDRPSRDVRDSRHDRDRGTAVRARHVEPVRVGPHHERRRQRARDGCREQDEGRSRQLPAEEHGRDRRRALGAAQ
jgi:hypothetical protein